jgi:hypothetical protein
VYTLELLAYPRLRIAYVSNAIYYIYIAKKKNKGKQMGHTKKIKKGD